MPIHDWTRVDAGIFHSFHLFWLGELAKALNGGLLSDGYYAFAEQHSGRTIPDILTLHGSEPSAAPPPSRSTERGGTAVADAPPRLRHHESVEPDAKGRRRTLTIRHVSGHRLIALFELVSPGNNDRCKSVETFVDKVVEALRADVHVAIVDLFPPGRFDPHGMPGAIRERLVEWEDTCETPIEEPLTLATYVAGPAVDIYSDYVGIGAKLPELPLFLDPERYVNLPLDATYTSAYQGMPAYWREVLEGRRTH